MIETVGLVLIGRQETITPETRSVRRVTDSLRERAHVAWANRWPDRYEEWSRWNVQSCSGAFGSWNYVDFLTYEGLGKKAVPKLTHRLRYIPLLDHIDPEEVPPFDPPVLHHSWRLFTPSETTNDRGWVERLRRFEIRLGSLLDRPESQTVRGFEALLSRQGLELREYGRDQPQLVPLSLSSSRATARS
jgi:hypothetical protein